MTEADGAPKKTGNSRELLRPIGIGLFGSSLATAASYFAPESQASTLVGLVFLGLTAVLVRRSAWPSSRFGLEFGGLFESGPLSSRRIGAETARALLIATVVAALVFPLFTIGYVFWFEPRQDFSFQRAFSFGGSPGLFPVLDLVLAHVLVVALPEETFFRGYLQSSLSHSLDAQRGARALIPNFMTSLLFALGHFATEPVPSRLAVFFPSLLFGLLRQRSGGVGASIFFHTFSNLYSAFLAAGFGFGG